jgi:hypothetical protein
MYLSSTKHYKSNIEDMSSNVEQEHLPILSLFMTEVGGNHLKSIAIGTTSINVMHPDSRLPKIDSI